MPDRPNNGDRLQRLKAIGLVAGVGAFLAVLVAPAETADRSTVWAVAAVGVLMAIWWMTEAVPLATTALLPIALFPFLGIAGLEATAASYAHPLILLFLGGFMLARAMEVWNLHKRIALNVLRFGGKTPASLVLGMMGVTAFLSMWVSNTATTMMMLPIGQSIIAALAARTGPERSQGVDGFAAALMLGIAYSATIGGMGTLIGTPPNALFAGFMSDTYGIKIGFAEWMMVGIPVVVILLPVSWIVLTRLAFPVSGARATAELSLITIGGDPLGPMSRGERLVAAVMLLTAAGWILRPAILLVFPDLALTDAGIAVMATVVLFMTPVDRSKGRFLLSWDEALRIRWDVLILFGGGLALATAMDRSGLVNAIAGALSVVSVLPLFVLVLVVMTVVVTLGELASNTAMAAIFLPIAGAISLAIGSDPLFLALPVAMAASLGFMLPVATPPNAIIFSSGAVTVQQMVRAGAVLDVVCIAIVAAICTTLGFTVFGVVGG